MNVVSNPTSNFIITIIRSLSYFILIWWLLNIYSIKYEIEKLHRIQLYCEGDIMEQETFRYNLYKINDNNNNTNKNVKKIKDKIETFRKEEEEAINKFVKNVKKWIKINSECFYLPKICKNTIKNDFKIRGKNCLNNPQ